MPHKVYPLLMASLNGYIKLSGCFTIVRLVRTKTCNTVLTSCSMHRWLATFQSSGCFAMQAVARTMMPLCKMPALLGLCYNSGGDDEDKVTQLGVS